MKLKEQREMLDGRATYYKTKYQEIYQELIAEIMEPCPTATQ